jgi:hypothetical protein
MWGLSLIALSIAMHATAVVVMALELQRLRHRLEGRARRRSRRGMMVAVVLIAVVGMALAALHGLEAAVWAAAYWGLGAIGSLGDAFLYSVDSITTRGANVLRLDHPFRMMGAIESICGMLLFGISTAFIFAVMRAIWELMTDARRVR